MRHCHRSGTDHERGAAVVDFVLVLLILVPLFLGLIQVGLVLYVRTSAVAAAAEGARYAARIDRGPDDGVARSWAQLQGVVDDLFVDEVSATTRVLDGVAVIEVRIRVHVPALGLWGPGLSMTVTGHGVREVAR